MLPTLFGALGGFLNALLLLLQIPEKVVDFRPVILGCGAFHGAVLAACAILGANVACRYRRLRWPACLLAGHIGGWISWIPTHHLIADHPLIKSALWPFTIGNALDAAWRPFQYFGLVALLLAAALSLATPSRRRSPWTMRALAIASGILGSFWFWALMRAHISLGYMAALHGTLWGLLVGAAISWRTNPQTERTHS